MIVFFQIRNRPEIIINQVRNANIAEEWKDLLLQILERNPDNRISLEHALEHSIFKGCMFSLDNMCYESFNISYVLK